MAELNEVVAEAAEQVASEAIQVVTKTDARIVAGVAILGFGLGAVASYFWTRRRLEKKYEQVAEEEIDAMREHFRARLRVREEKPDLGGLGEKAQELGYASPTGPGPQPPEADPTAIEPKPPVPLPPRQGQPNRLHEALEEAQNRPDIEESETVDGWNWDWEKSQRQHRIPYVIHETERGEADFDQLTYTYYEGDDVVCDEQNKVLAPRDEIVGDHNLSKFGHGSGDPNVVYLRNDHLALEIELVRDPGSYTEEVRGIQHSEGGIEPRRRRSREDQ